MMSQVLLHVTARFCSVRMSLQTLVSPPSPPTVMDAVMHCQAIQQRNSQSPQLQPRNCSNLSTPCKLPQHCAALSDACRGPCRPACRGRHPCLRPWLLHLVLRCVGS